MIRESNRSADQTAALSEVLESYLAAAAAGRAPPRSELLAAHPELEEDLKACLASLDFIETAVAPQACDASLLAGGESLNALRQPIGDYRLVCELGRGGMGVVYKAEQISLAREVALKILPFTTVLNTRHVRRFKNEAQAAASLDHPHIVAVYAVGCERGVHYYAMQYVEGHSLAELLAAANPPHESSALRSGANVVADWPISPFGTSYGREYFQRVAELCRDAAEALHYAHQSGVVHRDIKPSNLLLNREGTLFVTDFGLAMTQTDTGLTITGDLLGTLRYMSPEQAAGRRELTDHRTDIYSLGATLFELVTRRPAFAETDRARLLYQIANVPPARPRRIDPTIPRDLETIVLKAMASEPGERYATAWELADDLRRYLEDTPIRATRPGLMVRSAKWSRRHRHLVAATVLFLMLAVFGLSISAVMITREKNEAVRQTARAEKNLEKVQEAVDSLLTSVAKNLADRPGLEEFRRELLVRALDFYQGFLDDASDEPRIRAETARVHERIADIYSTLGERDNAVQHHKAGLRILKTLCRELPGEPGYREHLAETNASIAHLLLEIRRGDGGGADVLNEGETYWNRALHQWQHLVAAEPSDPRYRERVAACHFNPVYHPRNKADPSAGVRHAREGLRHIDQLAQEFPAYPIDKGLQGRGHYFLGMYLDFLRKAEEAERHYRTSFELGMSVRHQHRLAFLMLKRGAIGEAEELMKEQLAIVRQYAEKYSSPMSPYHRSVSHSQMIRSFILLGAGRWDEAEAAIRESVRISGVRLDFFPDNPMYKLQHALSCQRLGDVQFAAGQRKEAFEAYGRALPMFEDVAVHDADSSESQSHAAYYLATCPSKRLRRPRLAVDLATRAVELAPSYDKYRIVLATAQFGVGDYAAVVDTLTEAQRQNNAPLPSSAQLMRAMAISRLGDHGRGREIYTQTTREVDEKRVYSEWYTTQFRILRDEADAVFAGVAE